MNKGTENRKKTIIAGGLGAVALIAVGTQLWGFLGGSDTPKPPAPPVIKDATVPAARVSTSSLSNAAATRGVTTAAPSSTAAVAPGVAATVLANASSSLDPTLDEAAMLRTESLVYTGTGRNIFSATYTPPPPPINIPNGLSARPKKEAYVPPPPPPPPPTCPPTCPPINLKFFGTLKDNGRMQGFFLAGDDVYLAKEGDIVSRKYKIVSIGANTARVEDLQNNNTQSLPLQQ